MPVEYKGFMIPIATDLANGALAFQQFVDSMPGGDIFENGFVQIGTVEWTVRAAAPTGWLMLLGQTVTGAATSYAELWGLVPASWKSGSDLVLPDSRGRVLIASDGTRPLGGLSGSATITLAEGNLPPHTHAQQGGHLSGGASARHRHASLTGLFGNKFIVSGDTGAGVPLGGGAHFEDSTADDSPDHAHTTYLSGPTGGGNGSSVPVGVAPPALALNAMIRAL